MNDPILEVFPMQWAWRIALGLLPVLGLVALVTAGLELSGIVSRNALLRDASDAERYVALAFGVLILPFGITAWRHARMTIEDRGLGYLGFGFVCKTRWLAFDDVTRWGHAVGSNQGRREPLLLFELRDHSTRLIKLAMYDRQDRIRELLTERLGAAAPASATMSGMRFD